MYDHTNYQMVRPDILQTLDDYAQKGLLPGGFCEAVLSNDLIAATTKADADNRQTLVHIVRYVYNELPMGSWGSRDNVRQWLERVRNNEQEVAA